MDRFTITLYRNADPEKVEASLREFAPGLVKQYYLDLIPAMFYSGDSQEFQRLQGFLDELSAIHQSGLPAGLPESLEGLEHILRIEPDYAVKL